MGTTFFKSLAIIIIALVIAFLGGYFGSLVNKERLFGRLLTRLSRNN